MVKLALVTASMVGFLAVAIGAFGAHGLEPWWATLPDGADRLRWFKTGSLYHLVHIAAFVGVAMLPLAGYEGPWLMRAYVGFVAGLLLFVGSLYVMSITGTRVLGAVTPIGGLALLFGWLGVFMAALTLGSSR